MRPVMPCNVVSQNSGTLLIRLGNKKLPLSCRLQPCLMVRTHKRVFVSLSILSAERNRIQSAAQTILAQASNTNTFAAYEEARRQRIAHGLTDEEKAAGWFIDQYGVRRLPHRFDDEDDDNDNDDAEPL